MLFSSKRKVKNRKKNDPSKTIALVIPCHNEANVIQRKIENSLGALEFTDNSNIYVIDDGSSDNTSNLVEEYRKNHNIKNIFIHKNVVNKGKTASLNQIFPKLKEDIIVITDADALLEKNSVCELVSNFADQEVGAVTGRLVTNSEKEFSHKEEGLYRKISEIWRMGESNLDSCAVFNGPIMAFRGSLTDKFVIDRRYNADDTCLAYEIRRLGFRTIYEPNALASEFISDSIKVRFNQEVRRARGLTKIIIKNLGMLGHYSNFGKIILPFSLFNFIISPIITIILIVIFPLVIIEYPLVLGLFALLLIPFFRTALFGYLYRQFALTIGLTTKAKVKWKPSRSKNGSRKLT